MVQKQGDQQTATINSSIALLQKRFRELERMKVMRQERELMRMLSKQSHHHHHHRRHPKLLLHHHKKQPSSKFGFINNHHVELKPAATKPSIQLSLSLWPEVAAQKKQQQDCRRCAVDTTPPRQVVAKPWLTDDDNYVDGNTNNSDVDTSLHL